MIKFFKDSKQADLITLINTIRFDTLNYFFKPLESLRDLKDLSFELIAQIWSFYFKSFVEACNSMNFFLEIFISFDVPIKENVRNCLFAALNTLTYFAASFALILLDMVRMSFVLCASIIKLIFDDTALKRMISTQEKIMVEHEDLNKLSNDILEQQDQCGASLNQVVRDMVEFDKQTKYFLSEIKKRRGDCEIVSSTDFLQKNRVYEIIASIRESRSYAPTIDPKKINNLDYLSSLYKSLSKYQADLSLACEALSEEIRISIRLNNDELHKITSVIK